MSVNRALTTSKARRPAFTRTYAGANKRCGTVLYGIAPGSVLYLTAEMAARAAAGAWEAASAVAGRAVAAFVVGYRVEFTKQGGQA